MLQWFSLIALLPFALANAKTMSEAEYWEKTKLPASLAAKFINNDLCHSSEAYLASCRAALRTAYNLAGLIPPADGASEFERTLADVESNRGSSMPVQMFRAKVINAHLYAFDAHSEIRPSAMLQDRQLATQTKFVGIGVIIEPTALGPIVREVTPGSPAEKAGIAEDDIVAAVAKNGLDLESINKNLDRAADLIMGAANTPVMVRVIRGAATLDFAMKRAQVVLPLVTSSMIDGTGYLRIHTFESLAVCSRVIAQLNTLMSKGMKKLIIDVRGNPGGDKGMAVCAAELFLGARHVVGTKSVSNAIPVLYDVMQIESSLIDNGGKINWEGGYVARPKFTGPMVVLVDSLSASAAEILAGALQDYNRAWLVGDRSSGKGTVQSEEFVPNFPSLTLKYTIERFYQPSGRTNQAVGLIPSFAVPRRKGQEDDVARPLREADLHANSLAPENRAWIETRPKEVTAISDCLSRGQLVDKNLDAFALRGEVPDFQKAHALAILSCR